jgi:hypothetical protein
VLAKPSRHSQPSPGTVVDFQISECYVYSILGRRRLVFASYPAFAYSEMVTQRERQRSR